MMDQSILAAYGRLLENEDNPVLIDLSKLPASKEHIKQLLTIAILSTNDEDLREQLKSAYLFLANFQPGIGDSFDLLSDEGMKALEKMNEEIQMLGVELENMG